MKPKRPNIARGETEKIKTGCGNLYVTRNAVDGKLYEVFLNMGKIGGCAAAHGEALGRLISYCLRIGGDIQEIVKELKGIRCHQPVDDCLSCVDAAGKVLEVKTL